MTNEREKVFEKIHRRGAKTQSLQFGLKPVSLFCFFLNPPLNPLPRGDFFWSSRLHCDEIRCRRRPACR